MLKSANSLSYWLFGAATSAERELLQDILKEADPVFMKWAIDKIARWGNKQVPEGVIHIHGSADRILPLKFVHADITIDNAGHFMVLNEAEQISALLKALIK